MKNIYIVAAIITVMSFGCLKAIAAELPEIRVITEDYPPYEYPDQSGKAAGMSTEIVQATLEKAGIKPSSYKIYPWVRAYEIALKENNILIHTIERTPEREDLFKWVGPLYEDPIRFSLFKLKKRQDIKIDSLEDVKAYRVGVVRGFANHKYLLANGFEDGKELEPVADDISNIKKLFAGRVDLMIGEEYNYAVRLKELQLPYSELESVFVLRKSENFMYMAYSKQTPDEVVNQTRTAFEEIKNEGVIDAIITKYRRQLGIQE